MKTETINAILAKHPNAKKVCLYVDTSGSSICENIVNIKNVVESIVNGKRNIKICGFCHYMYWSGNFKAPYVNDSAEVITNVALDHLMVPGGTDFYPIYDDIEKETKKGEIIAIIFSDMEVSIIYPACGDGDVLRNMNLNDSNIYYDTTIFPIGKLSNFKEEYTSIRNFEPQFITE